MPSISVGLGRRKPNPHGIRQPAQRQMLIAKHLTLFFVVCLQMCSIGFLTLSLPRKLGRYLETTYEGTNNVKDTKLQMLTTQFEKLRMSEDESLDSFYSKLNEVVIGKFNLGEKTEDSKVIRKILWSLLESFRAKVTAIEERKDLDEIKVQELASNL